MNLVVFWTWRKHRVVPSKKEATRLLKVWKRWYERRGWRVTGNGSRGYTAFPPGFTSTGVATEWIGTVHAIGLREVPDELMGRIAA